MKMLEKRKRQINLEDSTSEVREVTETTVSHAEQYDAPMEFPARQVYAPASSRVAFLRVKTSISLSVVFKPAV